MKIVIAVCIYWFVASVVLGVIFGWMIDLGRRRPMAKCPKCGYGVRDNELRDEMGEEFFYDGCPKCGYGAKEVSELMDSFDEDSDEW